jgi:ankyrin repeat protein
MLIERGADVAAQNMDGWTPLHLASPEGKVDVAHMLIERGADVRAQDGHGWTPLRRRHISHH